MKTIHESAAQALNIYRYRWEEWRGEHPSCPDWIAAKIVAGIRRKAFRQAARDAVTPRHRFRLSEDWAKTKEDKAELTGLAGGLRRETGLSGSPLRALAVAVRDRLYSRGADLATADAVPDSALGGVVGRIRVDRRYVTGPENTCGQGYVWGAKWADGFHPGFGVQSLIMMALSDAVRDDLGAVWARRELARLESSPSARISGYLADTIEQWRAGRLDGTFGYEGCSGGQIMTYYRHRPALWDHLMSRAPVGQATATAIQCYPHERNKSAACHAAGLFETLRMSDSIYSGSPEKIAAVLQCIAA